MTNTRTSLTARKHCLTLAIAIEPSAARRQPMIAVVNALSCLTGKLANLSDSRAALARHRRCRSSVEMGFPNLAIAGKLSEKSAFLSDSRAAVARH